MVLFIVFLAAAFFVGYIIKDIKNGK